MKRFYFAAALTMLAVYSPAQTLVDGQLSVTNFATGLTAPTAMVFLAPNDLLVTEKNTGRVQRVVNGVVTSTALTLAVDTNSERGLLGMQKSPTFSTDNLIYLFYTSSTIRNRISRFSWNGSTLISEQILLDMDASQPLGGANHNGGVLLFGPPNVAPASQKLFAIIGDLNRNNRTENFAVGGATDTDDSGCVLRINPDGTIPSGQKKGRFSMWLVPTLRFSACMLTESAIVLASHLTRIQMCSGRQKMVPATTMK